MANLMAGAVVLGLTLAMLAVHMYGVATGILGFKRYRSEGSFDASRARRVLSAVLVGEAAYYAIMSVALLFMAPIPVLLLIMGVMLVIHVVATVGNESSKLLSRLSAGGNWLPTLRRLYLAVGVFDGAEFIILLYVFILLYSMFWAS